jgi:hypothetical protein
VGIAIYIFLGLLITGIVWGGILHLLAPKVRGAITKDVDAIRERFQSGEGI